MKLFGFILFVVALAESTSATPAYNKFLNLFEDSNEVLTNLSGSLSGQYALFNSNITNILSAYAATENYNASTTLKTITQQHINIINEVTQYSGPTAEVLVSIFFALPGIFTNLAQTFQEYSEPMGSEVTNILVQEVHLIKNAFATLIIESVDVDTINANALSLFNALELFVVTSETIKTILLESLTDEIAEALSGHILFIDTVFSVSTLVYFLLVPSVTDNATLTNLSSIITNTIVGLEFVTDIWLGYVLQSTSPLAQSLYVALPVFQNAAFAYYRSLVAVPNILSSDAFAFGDPTANLAELKNAFYNMSGNVVGDLTGADIYNTIYGAYASQTNNSW